MKTKFAAAVVGGFLATVSVMADGLFYSKKADSESVSRFRDQFYVRANLNLPTYRKFSNYTSKFRVGGQVAAGWCFHKDLSAELETGYFSFPVRNKDVPGGDNRKVTAWVGFVNIVAHPNLLNDQRFKPFAGAGIGYTRTRIGQSTTDRGFINTEGTRKTSGHLAYQLFLGVEWLASQQVSILADVRWVGLGKVKVPIGPPLMLESNRLGAQTCTLGVKYKF
jgi:opacity protein-like surface antigen